MSTPPTDTPPNTPPNGAPEAGESQREQGEKGKAPGTASSPPPRSLFGLLALLLIALLAVMFLNSSGGGTRIDEATFTTLWEEDKIVEGSVIIKDSQIQARQKPGPDSDRETTVYVPFNRYTAENLTKRVHELTNGQYTTRQDSVWPGILMAFGPLLLIILIIWFFIARMARNAGGGPGGMLGNFGKSKHRMMHKEMTGVTFADVAGIAEAKSEVSEIIEFLKNPKRFTRLGGRIPRGVLLVGSPGCGKTLLAKAIAGEADVPFFSISGSDFVEMFVGVGASRVRDLFKSAKESSPCIVFLDEIDAVGRKRGSGFSSGGHDEREQTLNAILVEMDGFNPADGVIVIAATNRSDVLDPALVRPGRFDRQIQVPLPDVEGRLEILKVHAKKVRLGPDVDLERLAKLTPMFSGADLSAIINEAAIAATLANKDFIEQEDLEESRDKVRFGRSNRSRRIEEKERVATAYHEAGHAVLQALLPDTDPLHKVTIIPRGQALGATMSMPDKDRYGYSKKWILATMRMTCGGRIAEERQTQDVSSGAAMDISQVTRLARAMIEQWGMSDRLGFVHYGEDDNERFVSDKPFSDDTAKIIDEEVRRIVDEAYRDAERMLDENWQKVIDVSEALLQHETLTADEVHQLMRGEQLRKSGTSALLANERRRNAPGTTAQPDGQPDDGETDAGGTVPTPA